MSKREAQLAQESGYSIFVQELEARGYLPEAVNNWIALMGWSYDDHTEFFTLADLIEKFSLDRLNPAPAAINFSKLDHFNGLHIRNLPPEELATRLMPFFEKAGYSPDEETLLRIAPIIQERIHTLEDAPDIAGFFFEEQVNPETDILVGKKMTVAESARAATRAYNTILALPDLAPDTLNRPLRDLADELGLKAGQLFGVLRGAVTGRKVSPPLFETMVVLGKEKVLERLEIAIEHLKKEA
jgi:glutamyl-tRNA synthetase